MLYNISSVLVVGLTGNLGSGKSVVLGMFARLGAFTLSADEIVGRLLKERPVLDRLRAALGNGAFDERGRLIKARAAEMIFSDKGLRLAVEDVLHPLVFERIDEALKGARPRIAVIEAPLIFERRYEGRFNKIITVHADEEAVLKRLERAGTKRDDALRRLGCQMPAEEKIRRADYAIDNSGSAEETERQVKDIYITLTEGISANGNS